MTMTNTFYVYTCAMGAELYMEEQQFYAESCILDAVETDVYELEVDKSVKLQIQYEKDGVKVYKVHPSRVVSFNKLELETK